MHSFVSASELEDLQAATERELPQYLRDLERLVNVDCGSYTKAGVDEVGRWAEQKLKDLGASVVRHANTELGDTIVGTFVRDEAGPSVLLIGHLDTVFDPGTAAERPFTIRGGRAFGPGVSDMKAGLLTGLYALRSLRAVGTGQSSSSGSATSMAWLPVGRLVFVVNPDEEIGSPVSTAVIADQAAAADVALVLEAARENGDIVSARKGQMDIRLDIRGRSAHAGVEPENGRSAILEAAHKIVALHELNGRFPGVTVNVGVMHGGTRPNIVADSASIEVDVRAAERAQLASVEAAIESIADDSTVPDVSTTIELVSRHWPMEKTEASARLVEQVVQVASQLGLELRDVVTGGASDGNTTAGLGVPTIDGLGPVGGLDHAPTEYVDVDSIVPRTTLLAGVLRAIGRAPFLSQDAS